MTGSDDTTQPKTTVANKKPYGITNIKNYIPLVLDLNELNNDSWSELFILYYNSFGVLNIIKGTSSANERATKEWGKIDSLVKLWIFRTISKPLLQRVLKKNISRIADLLANIDSPVDEKNIVTYAINDLLDKYEGVAGIIRHRETPPTFAQAQSMVLLDESHLNHRSSRDPARDSSTSSPHVLLAASNNRNNNNIARLYRNFQRGSCSFGKWCEYVHSNPAGARNRNNNNRPSAA
nr:hybrid signal transduction histidine kinase M [Tanacetum cinerariifolium]GFA51224.1 hybrid signal transduction histidine kinase M [Tanacetum cinerariifolium]